MLQARTPLVPLKNANEKMKINLYSGDKLIERI